MGPIVPSHASVSVSVACALVGAIPVARNSAAIPVRNSFFISVVLVVARNLLLFKSAVDC